MKPLDTHSTAILPRLAILNKIQAFIEKPVYFSKKDPNFERFEKSHCFSHGNLGTFCNHGNLGILSNLDNFSNLGTLGILGTSAFYCLFFGNFCFFGTFVFCDFVVFLVSFGFFVSFGLLFFLYFSWFSLVFVFFWFFGFSVLFGFLFFFSFFSVF